MIGSARPGSCPFLQLSAVPFLYVRQAISRKYNRQKIPGNPRCWTHQKDGCCPRHPGQPSGSAIWLTNLTDSLPLGKLGVLSVQYSMGRPSCQWQEPLMFHFIAMFAASLVGTHSPASVAAEESVKTADDAFWVAFNTCDRRRMEATLAPDIEFYHDKTGATTSRDAVVASFMDGPCGTKGLHVRRELVAGSLSYDPVPGFGAILTGRHRFYARRDGQSERLDGEARFAVVWQDVNGKLLMHRVLSYAHGPAVDQPAPVPVEVPLEALRRYVGHYASPMGDIAVTLKEGRLHIVSGGLSADLVAVAIAKFQAQGRPLTFAFVGGGDTIEKMVVEENGVIVAEGTRQDTH